MARSRCASPDLDRKSVDPRDVVHQHVGLPPCRHCACGEHSGAMLGDGM